MRRNRAVQAVGLVVAVLVLAACGRGAEPEREISARKPQPARAGRVQAGPAPDASPALAAPVAAGAAVVVPAATAGARAPGRGRAPTPPAPAGPAAPAAPVPPLGPATTPAPVPDAAGPAAPAEAAAPVPETPAEPLPAAQPAPQPDPEPATPPAEPRRVSIAHAGGTTEVVLPVRRVVSLHNFFNEGLAHLGIVPVGAVPFGNPAVVDGLVHIDDYRQGLGRAPADSLAAYIPPAMQPLWAAQTLAFPDGNPSLEAILALEPDLIVAHSVKVLELDMYEQLSEIAPTVLLDIDGERKAFLRTLADAVDRAAEAEQVIARYEESVAEARRTCVARLSGQSFAILRVSTKELKVKGDHRSGLVLYGDLGLKPASIVPIGKKDVKISQEAIPTIDADHLFVLIDRESAATFDSLLAGPVWSSVPAVQKNQVYLVPTTTWEQTGGIPSSQVVVDDFVGYFGR